MKEEELFNIVAKLGPGIRPHTHILDNTSEGDLEYRCYLNRGYCFDVKRSLSNDKFVYHVDCDFEGFNAVSVAELLEIIQS